MRIDRFQRTGKSAEAEAVRAGLKVQGLAVDLVALISCTNGASNKAGLEAEGAQIVAAGSSLAELVDDGTGRDGGRVSHSVAQRGIGGNVDLLAAGNDDAERKSAVTTSEDSRVARRARTGWEVGRAVAGWSGATEVKLSTTSSQGQEVDR